MRCLLRESTDTCRPRRVLRRLHRSGSDPRRRSRRTTASFARPHATVFRHLCAASPLVGRLAHFDRCADNVDSRGLIAELMTEGVEGHAVLRGRLRAHRRVRLLLRRRERVETRVRFDAHQSPPHAYSCSRRSLPDRQAFRTRSRSSGVIDSHLRQWRRPCQPRCPRNPRTGCG